MEEDIEENSPSAELKAQPAVLRATIQITRKATGKVETYELTGVVPAEPDNAEETR
jgi:hypothetical protein